MEEYATLIKLGSIVALVLLVGLALRVMGIRYKAGKNAAAASKNAKSKGRKKSSQASESEIYFKQDAYVGDGNGPTEFEDDDMYAMKEGKARKPGMMDGKDSEKKDSKLESWEDY